MTTGSPKDPGRRPARRKAPADPTPKPRAAAAEPPRPARSRRPEPEGFEPFALDPAPPPRPRPRPLASRPGASLPGPPAILTDLLRGPLALVGQMTGIEAGARAMERLAMSAERAAEILDRISADRIERLTASAERAAELLDRLDSEVGIERVISVLERLERLSETADQMNRSLRAIERLALDVQKRVIEPFDRLPIPRALRDTLGGGTRTKPER